MTGDSSDDPLQEVRDRGIERIVEHLNTVVWLVEKDPAAPPSGLSGEVMAQVEKVFFWLDAVHDGGLPAHPRRRLLTARECLEAANALAEKHLSSEGAEGKARLGIKRALMTLRRGR